MGQGVKGMFTLSVEELGGMAMMKKNEEERRPKENETTFVRMRLLRPSCLWKLSSIAAA